MQIMHPFVWGFRDVELDDSERDGREMAHFPSFPVLMYKCLRYRCNMWEIVPNK